MKRFLIAVPLFIVALSLSSCAQPGSPAANDLENAYAIVTDNVPFADNTNDLQFDRASIIEVDNWGRSLIRYRTPSVSLSDYIEIYLICQKTENGLTYFYRDYCYIIRYEESEPFSEDAIALLKERNDWNKALDMSKMGCVSLEKPDNVLYRPDFEKLLLLRLGLSSEYGVISHAMDYISPGQQLYFANVFLLDEEKNRLFDKYYLIICESGSRPIVASQEIENSVDCQDAVAAFRSNWVDIQ